MKDEDKNLVPNEAEVFATILFSEAKREERERASSLISSRFSRRQDVVSIYDPLKSLVLPVSHPARVALFCLSLGALLHF